MGVQEEEALWTLGQRHDLDPEFPAVSAPGKLHPPSLSHRQSRACLSVSRALRLLLKPFHRVLW